MIKTLLALALLVALSLQGNPGILVTVPFPLSPPTIPLELPYSLPDLLVQTLELTNIKLIEVNYQWQLNVPTANTNISQAVLSFDWSNNKHQGKGFFTEDHLQVILHWNFTQSKQHFSINIDRTQLKSGHSHVSLGGGVPQTVLIEVTNLILNHASAVFRSAIGSRLSKIIEDFSKVAGEDKQLLQVKGKGKLMLSTMLTAQPFFQGNTLYVQVNGAAYIKGHQIPYLLPSDVLVAPQISKIQAQIHTKVMESVIGQYLELTGGFNLEFKSYDINSVLKIDSLALSPVFPPMAQFQSQVIFDVQVPTLNISMQNSVFTIKAALSAQIAVNKQGKKQNYMKPVAGGFSVSLMPVFGRKAESIRIVGIKVDTFQPDPTDIRAGLVVPAAIEKYFPILMDWIQDAANLELNRRLFRPSYESIQVVLNGETYKEYSYNLQIDLEPMP